MNMYIDKIAKVVGLKGDLLPNKAQVKDQSLIREMNSEIQASTLRNGGIDGYVDRMTGRLPHSKNVYSVGWDPNLFQSHQEVFHPPAAPGPRNDAKRYERWLRNNASEVTREAPVATQQARTLLLEHKPLPQAAAESVEEKIQAQAVAKDLAKATKPAVAKGVSKGMSLGAKLGLGGLAAAGLTGGAYYAMNNNHHKKRASAIEGLIDAGYSLEQALAILG